MTREEIIESRRVGFEEWAISEYAWNIWEPEHKTLSTWDGQRYVNVIVNAIWKSWNAALDRVVIELPEPVKPRPYACFESGWNDALSECSDAIESQGFAVK